ncbi:hypothetical protein LLG96_13520 [bacterium]|nr:hypothetical protein [bacterium]
MPDFHHNIFYYYRGARQEDSEFERQLEDNTTKALINVLEHCSQTVLQKFLEWLGIVAIGKTNFELQRKTIGDAKIKGKSKKLLLGLVPEQSAKQPTSENISDREDNRKDIKEGIKNDSREDSRPDAWIYGDNYVILIESKVVGNLDPVQMRFHRQKLQIDPNLQDHDDVRKWAEVHRFFAGILPELSDKNKWLVTQFIQYLEDISMAEFTGFKPEVFDYFIAHDDEEIRKWVRDTMQGFGEVLQPELYKLDHFYDGYDLGRLELKHNHSWIAFGPKDQEYKQRAHLSIAIHLAGLEVFLNVELKSATDKLKEKVCNNKDEFRKLLSDLQLDDPLWIQIEERKKIQAMVYDYRLISKIEVSSLRHSEIGSSSYEYLETLIDRLQYPYFSIRKLIDREEVCKLSRKDQGISLVNEVVRICEKFHSIVKFINS